MKQRAVRTITLFSVAISVVWFAGLGMIAYDLFLRESETVKPVPAEEAAASVLVEGHYLVALGDSLSKGVGDTTGKGYVGYVFDYLAEHSEEPVQLQNLAVSGYRSDQLVEQLKQEEVQRQIRAATTILITIGGNDLFQGGQTLLDLDLDKVKQLEDDYINNLNLVIGTLRDLNTDALILLSGLFNPFQALDDSDITSEIVMDWNYRTAKELAAYEKAVFVPTFDLYQLEIEGLLSSDKFHPNNSGYKRMAERVAALIPLAGEES